MYLHYQVSVYIMPTLESDSEESKYNSAPSRPSATFIEPHNPETKPDVQGATQDLQDPEPDDPLEGPSTLHSLPNPDLEYLQQPTHTDFQRQAATEDARQQQREGVQSCKVMVVGPLQ